MSFQHDCTGIPQSLRRRLSLWRRIERLLDRLEQWLDHHLPLPLPTEDELKAAHLLRWQVSANGQEGVLRAVHRPQGPFRLNLDDLLGIDRAKNVLDNNTARFAQGGMANHALLWGSRGTGKSSLVKAVAECYSHEGLKLVEIGREDLNHLPTLLTLLRPLPYRFILFCDDLSFEEQELSFKTLKSLLEGGVEAGPGNVLFYATSNRRHLIVRHFQDHAGEVHPSDSDEERISLSDRFGLWLGFHSFDQKSYLSIVSHYAQRLELGIPEEILHARALEWSRLRGARSGRVAWQFILDQAGQCDAVMGKDKGNVKG